MANRAKKALRRLQDKYSRRVLELLVLLQDDPIPAAIFDVEKLAGAKDTYRIRIGDIRVIFEVDWALREVRVLVVAQRESAYD